MTSTIQQLLEIDAKYERYVDPKKATFGRIMRKELILAKSTLQSLNRLLATFPGIPYQKAMRIARRAAWYDKYPSVFTRELRDSLAHELYKEIYNS